MTGPIEIVIKRRTPAGNKSTFGHWRDYAKERDIWSVLIRAKLPPKQKPAHRVKILVTSYRVNLQDRVNFEAGCKPIPDALVRLGYLRDDAIAWLDDTYRQIKSARAFECTVIRIENP